MLVALVLCYAASYPAQAKTLGTADINYEGNKAVCADRWPESVCNLSRTETSLRHMIANYIPALQMMAQQISSVAIQQTMVIGTFFDGKEQLEAQQDIETLKAEAHKDYSPSAGMCQFGSFVKTIAHSEERADVNHRALHEVLTDRYTGKAGMASASGMARDVYARFDLFKEHYCDPNDHNTALTKICGPEEGAATPSAEKRERLNKDIDYVRTAGAPLTLDIDFTNSEVTADELDVIELGKNLYWPVALDKFALSAKNLKNQRLSEDYMHAREVIAKHILAHNSYLTQVAMKSASPNGLGVQSGGAYMKALLVDFGLSGDEAEAVLGENPSYYAQMDVLTKRIYQDPDFYTNLYDKPTNVERMNASMQAIGLMQYRDRYDSQLRQELLISQMVENRLRDLSQTVSGKALSLLPVIDR